MYQTILEIEGMSCGMCEAHINNMIRKVIPEAQRISSSHKKGQSSYLTEHESDTENLRRSIEGLGYTVQSVQVKPYTKKGFLFFK